MARKKYSEIEIRAMKETAANIKRIMKLRGMSQTELSEKTNIPTSTISDYVNARTLVSMGNLEIISEALHVPKTELQPSLGGNSYMQKTIPLIGTICAGDGLLAEQNIEEYVHYPLLAKRQPDYALRVKGDSMIGAGIEDGDIVYMRYATWADYNGQIVAALINDQEDGTLKRIRWSSDSPEIMLLPENDNYSPIEVLPSEVRICGVYMGHFKPERDEKQ